MKQKTEKTTVDEKLAELEKKYGSRVDIKNLTIINTGSIQLNKALNIGGTPLGKMIELFGEESSGKSTVSLHQIAEYQKAFPDKKVAIFDYEHCFDPMYAKTIGVDIDSLLIYQPETQESGYDLILALVENDIVSCVVLDSQTAAIPKVILEGEMGDATMGVQARNNSKFCGKIKGLLDLHGVTLFIISQTRDNIGGMSSGKIPTGGNSFKFYCDMRWKIWKMNDKVNESNNTTIDIIKNKLGKPFGQAKISVLWGKGFDKISEIVDYAVEFGIIKKGGSWFTFNEEKFQGMENIRTFLENNPEVLEYITKEVYLKLENENT